MRARFAKLSTSQLVLAICLSQISLPAPSQQSTTPTAEQITKNCWTSKSKKTVSGKCPRSIEDQVFFCPTPTEGGGLGGTLIISRSDMLVGEGLPPDVLMACIGDNGANAMRMTTNTYDISLDNNAEGDLILSELRHKCSGNCDADSSQPLKGKITLGGEVLRWSRTDGATIEFSAYHDDKH